MKASLLKRFLTYQKERYPFLAYIFLIGSFSFSAIAYSRICRGQTTFVPLTTFALCLFDTLTLFFILRILDEFKDQEDDRAYRSYLPVPRGLISLTELKYIGIVTLMLQVGLTAIFFPSLLYLLGVVYAYLFLMSKEFFIRAWLKQNQFWYVTTHMLIIPLVDFFASGFDWKLNHEPAPSGLIFFFAVSFMNGIVLEIGRKIKPPDYEEPGVLSYTFQLGTRRAVMLWLGILLVTLALAILASYVAEHAFYAYFALVLVFIICLIPAIMFLKHQTKRNAKLIEYSSALWTFAMYLIIGGIPMLISLLK